MIPSYEQIIRDQYDDARAEADDPDTFPDFESWCETEAEAQYEQNMGLR